MTQHRKYRGSVILHTEGFWCDEPIEHQMPWHGKEQFLKTLFVVEEKAEKINYIGIQTCSICGQEKENIELHWKGWRWPNNYRHYVQVHNVRPSIQFQVMLQQEK